MATRKEIYCWYAALRGDRVISGIFDVEAMDDEDALQKAGEAYGPYLLQVSAYRKGAKPSGSTERVVWKEDGFDLYRALDNQRNGRPLM